MIYVSPAEDEIPRARSITSRPGCGRKFFFHFAPSASGRSRVAAAGRSVICGHYPFRQAARQMGCTRPTRTIRRRAISSERRCPLPAQLAYQATLIITLGGAMTFSHFMLH